MRCCCSFWRRWIPYIGRAKAPFPWPCEHRINHAFANSVPKIIICDFVHNMDCHGTAKFNKFEWIELRLSNGSYQKCPASAIRVNLKLNFSIWIYRFHSFAVAASGETINSKMAARYSVRAKCMLLADEYSNKSRYLLKCWGQSMRRWTRNWNWIHSLCGNVALETFPKYQLQTYVRRRNKNTKICLNHSTYAERNDEPLFVLTLTIHI